MKYKSYDTDQSQILKAIIEIHNEGKPFDCDPCFNKGMMYGDAVQWPQHRFDIKPNAPGVLYASAHALPFSAGCIPSLIIDPPFLIHSRGSENKMAQRYGFYESKEDLQRSFIGFINEAYRVLQENGLFVFKCQDVIHNRRRFFASLFVMNYALSVGFNLIDHAILLAKSRMRSPNTLDRCNTSYALHSWHSHFIVFRKKKSRTDYFVRNTPAVSALDRMHLFTDLETLVA